MNAALLVMSVSILAASAAETRTSVSGHTFTQVTDHPSLNNAWKDESGVIWGDLVSKEAMRAADVKDFCIDAGESGTCFMTQAKAEAYCSLIGASLPSREQFTQLATYLGNGSASHYYPEILPALTDNSFWSTTANSNDSMYGYVFNGSHGYTQIDYRSYFHSVRCVE